LVVDGDVESLADRTPIADHLKEIQRTLDGLDERAAAPKPVS
jgi:hypothetical protein